MPHLDPLFESLNQLSTPPPSAMAQANILRAARQMPPKGVKALLSPLRQVRAYWRLPQMRFSVMASVFGMLILLGLVQQFQHVPAPIPNELLLYDVAFVEYDVTSGWLDSMIY